MDVAGWLRGLGLDQYEAAFRDKPVEPTDRLGDGAMVGADDLAQVFGVGARGQRGRADEIAKHHRELAPLGFAGYLSRLGGKRHQFRRPRFA